MGHIEEGTSRSHRPRRRTGSGTRVFYGDRATAGGWFSQDVVDEFLGHDAAVADYADATNPQLVAVRLVGELHELLALPLDEGDYALAAAELGTDVGPPEPFSHGAWFPSQAATLSGV
ncbi:MULTISPECIES: contact-dependent growth inhibition system immunity protein [unclassified Streptomyces]|uniref:contact-dependent growth inhibition system immunity protein n=1 Tax=unclassified Streptomyces TaxID=2593676 RepID=UPI00081B9E07|nr:hypothetical protein GA0115247_112423 [Streptomyces sp. PalvLS-984]SDB89685.1 hypothetical protein F558DRAFT_00318 [Streptomyces sp. AmelKG-A3]